MRRRSRWTPAAALAFAVAGAVACVADDTGGAPPVDAALGEDGDDAAGPPEVSGADTAQPPRVDLVDHDLWRLTAAEDDPFAFERTFDRSGGEVTCPDDGWYVDLGLIEVDTGSCNYVTLEQPLAADVAAGARLAIVAWSGRLASQDGTTRGHIALTLGDALLWEAWVDVPSEGNFFTPTAVAAVDVPRGTPVRFHIHNHGFNTWNLVSLRLVD